MEIIRYASLKPAPWANGGGVTRQLAAGTPGSTTLGAGAKGDAWDWRISIAEVGKAGPFSALPGIDRILTIIDGELIALSIDGTEQALEKFRPFRFSGDSDTSASLPTGPLTDLNLMTRRGVFKGYATILELSKKRPHPVFDGQFAVLLQGSADVVQESLDDAGNPSGTLVADTLGRFDAVAGAKNMPHLSGRGFLAVLSIDPAAG
ncbi:HutD family protein [Arthrobacter sp. STN4]|uniref:HutD/Ves family protein n=1 Tax=Arthrobacter sp. STN4 TaxID=2923276 RepID=UPI00211A70EB|nr:HutD family protein [Arthrobacter sp. STN4]MCQ9164809.1 HutD family protein [Arthrobacter sp. STN4]